MWYVVFLAACTAGLPANELLLQPAQLDGLKNALVVDVRPDAAFQAGHLPGAAHLDQAALSEDRNGVANELKAPEQLQDILATAGLDADKHLVLYSAMDTPADLKNATRVLWALEYLSYEKVSILDGGFARWQAEKRPVETGATKVAPVKPGKVSVRPREALLADYETVVEMTSAGKGALVDCRAPEEYAGLSKKDFVAKKGNIPGAINVPAGDLVDPATHQLKPAKELAAAIAPIHADKDTPVVTYCNSGRDATVGYFMMRLNGHDHVAVYDGSMAEWASKERLELSAPAK